MTDYPKDGEPLVILWEWQYHVLGGDPVDSVEDAAIFANANAEEGRAAFECIEVVHPDGTSEIITGYEAHLPPPPPPPKVEGPPKVAKVLIGPPPHLAGKGRPFTWSLHETLDEAEAEAARWRSRLGDDRVEVRPL